MQSVRRINLCCVLLWTIAFSGNSYPASRDSQATLHIGVTLVTTIATGSPEPVQPTQVASSGNQGIIYRLRPEVEQNVADAIVSTSNPKAQKPSPTNLNDALRDDSVVEVTTVVTK